MYTYRPPGYTRAASVAINCHFEWSTTGLLLAAGFTLASGVAGAAASAQRSIAMMQRVVVLTCLLTVDSRESC
jgi:hypothetical protein